MDLNSKSTSYERFYPFFHYATAYFVSQTKCLIFVSLPCRLLTKLTDSAIEQNLYLKRKSYRYRKPGDVDVLSEKRI